jgi:hypothetical protein
VSERTLFDAYEEFLHAEYQLEEAVTEGIGGVDWWREGGCGLPFSDWWFDTYDRSVELAGTRAGWEPTEEHLEALRLAGILKVYVSYEGAEADAYGRDAAWMWFWHDGSWKHGGCSARKTDQDKRGLVKGLLTQLSAKVGK